MSDRKFGGLPRGGGVTTIGDSVRLELDGSQSRRGPGFQPPKKSKRRLRSDQRQVQYQTLVAQGKTEEARALLRGQQVPDQAYRQRADDAQHLADQGLARSVDGLPLQPGAPLPKVIEGPLQNRPAPRGDAFTVPSSDGNTYLIPKAMGRKNDPDSMWKASITNSMNVIMLAVREMAIGGNPLAVFDAFGVRTNDMQGQPIFPVAPELRSLRPQYELTPDADAEAETFGRQLDDPEFVTASFGDPVTLQDQVEFGEQTLADDFDNVIGQEVEDGLGPYADVGIAHDPEPPAVHPVDALTSALGNVDADQLEAALSLLTPEQRQRLGIIDDGPVDPGNYGDPEAGDEG